MIYIHHRRQATRKAKRGYTMVEMLLFIAVAAVLGIGAVTLYGKSLGAAKETQATQQVAQVVKSVRQLYASDGTYGSSGGTSLNSGLINSRSLPDGMINTASGTIRHAFGDPITVTGFADRFTIQMAAVPQDGCAKLLTSLLAAGDLISLQIGSGGALTPPLTAGQVITDCSTASASNVTLTYR